MNHKNLKTIIKIGDSDDAKFHIPEVNALEDLKEL